MKQANPKSIPKLFVGETSFLSESADVAPDENSFVPKNETSSKLASQSSIPFEGLCDKANEEILLSQVQSSSLSLGTDSTISVYSSGFYDFSVFA